MNGDRIFPAPASLASVGMYYVPRPYPVSLCLSSRPALLSVQSSVHRTDPLKACSTGSFLNTDNAAPAPSSRPSSSGKLQDSVTGNKRLLHSESKQTS